jgi:hypothetical protein
MHRQRTMRKCLRVGLAGGDESIILSAGGAESMMLSACTERMDFLSASTESIILLVPPTESMILSAVLLCYVLRYANSGGYVKNNWQY